MIVCESCYSHMVGGEVQMTEKDFVAVLDLAIEALEICNAIHQRTGALKVPLDDVVEEMGNRVTKKQIQDGFWVLVSMGIIGDDGDVDHMNYDGNNELTELLKQIRVTELEKSKKVKAENVYL